MKAKWIYLVWTDYKRVLTNRKSCPSCGEYRKIERIVTFVLHSDMGLVKPYRCKSCGFHIDVATGDRLDHINKNGRDYPLDRTIRSDIPLWGEEDNLKEAGSTRVYECDSLCIRFMKKECTTESEDGMCDQPDMYREIGDVADALNDEALFK